MNTDIVTKISSYTNNIEKLLLVSKNFNEIFNKNKTIISLKKNFGNAKKNTIIKNVNSYAKRSIQKQDGELFKWLLSNKCTYNQINVIDHYYDVYRICNSKIFIWFLNKYSNVLQISSLAKIVPRDVNNLKYLVNNKLITVSEYHQVAAFVNGNLNAISYIDELIGMPVELVKKYLENPTTDILLIYEYVYELYYKKTCTKYQNDKFLVNIPQYVVCTLEHSTIQLITNVYTNVDWSSHFLMLLIRRNYIDIAKKILSLQANEYSVYEKIHDIVLDEYISNDVLADILSVCKNNIEINTILLGVILTNLERAKVMLSVCDWDTSYNNYELFRTSINFGNSNVVKFLYSLDPIGIDNIYEELFYELCSNDNFSSLNTLLNVKQMPKICAEKYIKKLKKCFHAQDTENKVLQFYNWLHQKKLEGFEIDF